MIWFEFVFGMVWLGMFDLWGGVYVQLVCGWVSGLEICWWLVL